MLSGDVSLPAVDEASLRMALGHFGTGVTIITARASDGKPVGLTASSFNALSLSPPLVLWSLGLKAGSLPAFRQCSHYAIHVLQASQRELAERFSRRVKDRFEGLHTTDGLGDAPLLPGAAAVFECSNVRRSEEGDHMLFVGAVQRVTAVAQAQPLLYHGGRFFTELPLADPQNSTHAVVPHFVGDYLGYLLGQANHAVYKRMDADLQRAGLSHIEWRVLAVLHESQGLSVTALAQAILSKQPTVTKLLQRMQASGWVQLGTDAEDQRKTTVHATERGQQLAASLIALVRSRHAQAAFPLSQREQIQLKALLRKLTG